MKLCLVDINPALVAAWQTEFRDFPEVSIGQGDILAIAEHTIVSPANSHGFMDGGIDAAYLSFFGTSLQRTVQAAIRRRPEGSLPVGASLVVATGHPRIPNMIVAPTMEMPEAVNAAHAYRALRAALRLVTQEPDVGKVVYCPGLATLTGRVPVDEAAHEMAEAYRDWKTGFPGR